MLRKRLGISHLLQGLSVPLLPLQLLLLLLWVLSLHPKHLQQLLVHLVTSLLHFLATLRHTLDSCHPGLQPYRASADPSAYPLPGHIPQQVSIHAWFYLPILSVRLQPYAEKRHTVAGWGCTILWCSISFSLLMCLCPEALQSDHLANAQKRLVQVGNTFLQPHHLPPPVQQPVGYRSAQLPTNAFLAHSFPQQQPQRPQHQGYLGSVQANNLQSHHVPSSSHIPQQACPHIPACTS